MHSKFMGTVYIIPATINSNPHKNRAESRCIHDFSKWFAQKGLMAHSVFHPHASCIVSQSCVGSYARNHFTGRFYWINFALPSLPSLHSILIESSFSDIHDKAWPASEFLSRTAAILYHDPEDLKWRGINYRQQIKHVEIWLSVTKSSDHTARKNDNFCFFPLKYFSS